MNNSDLARDIAIELATRVSAPTVGWSWSKGVVLFPESRCPFCKGVMKSRAVWLVQGNYLIGQAVPVAGRELVLDPPEHPHATPSAICMGNAREPLQALFNGLNPKSSYFNANDEITGGMCPWLRGPYWEHSCDEMADAELRAVEETEENHDGNFYCEGCEDYFEEVNEFNDNYYCESCFSDVAFKCYACRDIYADDNRYTYDDDSYCSDCFHNRFFYCEGCNDDYPQDDCKVGTDGNSYCGTCWESKFFECSACGETLKKSAEAGNSLCGVCSETCEQCQSTYEVDTGDYCIYCIKNVCDSCSQLHGEQCNLEASV